LHYLNLEGNTLGVDAAKGIAKALEEHSEFRRALWKDMFTGRMKTEIPKALVSSMSYNHIFSRHPLCVCVCVQDSLVQKWPSRRCEFRSQSERYSFSQQKLQFFSTNRGRLFCSCALVWAFHGVHWLR